MERQASDLAIGLAAEHLVCADLLLQGYRAFLADQNCPFDVAVEHRGRLYRIQVRSTREARRIPQRKDWSRAYYFQVRRAGKGGRRAFKDDEIDILALVALDIRQIAYLPISGLRQSFFIRHPADASNRRYAGSRAGRRFEDFPAKKVLS